MTGFPGETEEDFRLLLDFQQKAKLDWAGCFAYSREEDTPAWSMKGRVSKKTAEQRKLLVEENQTPITEKQMDRFIDRVFDALVEEAFPAPETAVPGSNKAALGKGDTFLYLGRLPCHAPEIDGSAVILSPIPLKPGALIPCKVFARAGFDLQVQPVLRDN